MEINDISIKKLKTGDLKEELPEIYELSKVIENNYWHNHESVLDHTLRVLQNYETYLAKAKGPVTFYLDQKIDNHQIKDLIFLAILFHDLGKKETLTNYDDGSSLCPLHEKLSVVKAKKILARFNLGLTERRYILNIVKYHSYLHSIVVRNNYNLEKQFNELASQKSDFIIGLVIMAMMDIQGGYFQETKPEEYQFEMNFYRQQLKLKTNFLMVKNQK